MVKKLKLNLPATFEDDVTVEGGLHAGMTIGRTITTHDELISSDAGTLVIINSSSDAYITIPHSTFEKGTLITLLQSGAGTITVDLEDVEKQLLNDETLSNGQNQVLQIICLDDTTNNENWIVIGGDISLPLCSRVSVSAGYSHSLAIDKLGCAFGWGSGSQGVLGNGLAQIRSTPVAVCGNHTFCQIIGHQYSSLAIDKNGKAWSWGASSWGMLGNNTASGDKCTPVAVCGNHTFCQIVAADRTFIALDKNGKAWSWGLNLIGGSLGNNTASGDKCTPVAVCGNHTFCQIAGNLHGFLALDKNRKAWSWGNNADGLLGDNTTINRSTPVAVCGNHTFCQIARRCGIDATGKAWSWGPNSTGGVGDNTTINKSAPVAVCGNHTFCQIRRGHFASGVIGLDKNGQAWTWGMGNSGHLGDNTTINKSAPVAVCGNHTFCQIAHQTGTAHRHVIDNKGRIWGWGDNGFGTLGDNTATSRLTPVRVCGF